MKENEIKRYTLKGITMGMIIGYLSNRSRRIIKIMLNKCCILNRSFKLILFEIFPTPARLFNLDTSPPRFPVLDVDFNFRCRF